MALVIEKLVAAIRSAAVHNPEVQAQPACILWPDRDRQWEAVIPRLQAEMPELLAIGDYAPQKRTGPAVWLRCVIAGQSDDVPLSDKHIPIFYLPGISRQDLRAVDSCPDHLKPLAELQYRGVIWSQVNAKDWTVLAFLKSELGGLGLDVGQDNDSKNAMQLAIYRFLDEELDLLKGRRLDKDYFNTLLTGGDPVRDVLQWLDQEDAFRTGRGENEWKAFVGVCKSQLAFNPEKEGVLSGAAKLAAHEGPWLAVWQRFCEVAIRYPNIPAQIRKCNPPSDSVFWHAGDSTFHGWPQWNEKQEKSLQRELHSFGNIPAHQARLKLLELEKQHGKRRSLIWAELGEAPMARAIGHLSVLAETTQNGLAAGSIEEVANAYRNNGWKADDAVIQALSTVEKPEDLGAVSTAIRSVYLPWAEESARYLQKLVNENGYPGGTLASAKFEPRHEGECVFFTDGLRFDTARCLLELLEKSGYVVSLSQRWAALPSVTETGKPAVAPLTSGYSVADEPQQADFQVLTPYQFDKALRESGWLLIRPKDPVPSPMITYPNDYSVPAVANKLWIEFGDIDHEGHDHGWKLSRKINSLLVEIRDRIIEVLDAGWERVRVVTDHGWLLLPGGLPKEKLDACLSVHKWKRFASIKPGASVKGQLYPWFWNPNQYFAAASGISCFQEGEEYSHGGLSLQECLTLELEVTPGKAQVMADPIEFTDIVWKGLRCKVAVEGTIMGLSLDIRIQAGDPASSVIVDVKLLKENGTASVVVENEDLEGDEAFLTLIDSNGGLVAQVATVIGGGKK